MLRMHEERADPAGGAGSGATPPAPFSAHVAEIAALVERLARIRAARWRLHTLQLGLLVPAALVLVVVAVALGLAGVGLFVGGLSAGLSELWPTRPWLADLVTGLLLLAGCGLLFAGVRAVGERRVLARLRRHDDTGA
jgi:hypothetical protein